MSPKPTSPLAAFSLLDGSSGRSLRTLEMSLKRRRLSCGERLWWTGDPAEHVVFLQHGLVQIVRTGASGDVSVFGFFGSGDAVGLTAALEGATYPADAVVVSQHAEVVRISIAALRTAKESDRGLAEAVERMLLEHARVMLMKVTVLSAGSIAARLATAFVHLADRFGVPAAAAGRTGIGVALTRATLAGFVDARVETVIRVLSTWRAAGLFAATSTGFEIDRAALVAISVAG